MDQTLPYTDNNSNVIYRYSEVGGWRWNTEEIIPAHGNNMILRPLTVTSQGVYQLWTERLSIPTDNRDIFLARRDPQSGWSPIHNLTGNDTDSWVTSPARSGYGVHMVVLEKNEGQLTTTMTYSNIINQAITADSKGHLRGSVTSAGKALADVRLELAGPENRTIQTDTNGNFLFSRLAAGTYTLTPSQGPTVFTPASTQVTIDASSTTPVNFTTNDPATGGGYWQVQNWDDDVSWVNDIFFVNNQQGWAAAGEGDVDGVVYKTTDGGNTWEKLEPPAIPLVHALNAVYFIDENTGWLAGNYGHVIYTADGGTTWETRSLPAGSGDIKDIYFSDSQNGWVAGHNALAAYTEDGGQTWTQLDTNLFQPTTAFDSLADIGFFNQNAGWMLGTTAGSGGATRIYYTFDQGRTWEDVRGTASGLLSISFFDTYLGIGGGGPGGIIVSTSDGYNFERRNVDNPVTYDRLKQAVMVSPTRGWQVGSAEWDNFGDYGATIITTYDGGINWQLQQSPTDENLFGAFFLDPGTGWAVGYNGTILRYHGSGSWTAPLPGKISGRVVDSDTGFGVPGVAVTTEPGGYSAFTNPLGLYTLHEIPDNTYTLKAEKPGFGSISQSGIQVTSDLVTVNFSNAGGAAQWIEDDQTAWSGQDNAYTMTGTGAGVPRIITYPLEMCDFEVEVDMRKTSGYEYSTYGIQFRKDTAADKYYRFLIAPGGYFKVSKWDNNEETIMHDYQHTAGNTLVTGLGTWNTIKVVAIGNHMRFYGNNALLYEYRDIDAPLSCGALEIFTFDTDLPTGADFDAIEIQDIRVTVPATDLSFETTLVDVQPSETFSAEVAVRDANGDIVVSDNTTEVRLAIDPLTGNYGIPVNGITTVTVVDGVASFTDLSIDYVGSGYQLAAFADELNPDLSSSFNVNAVVPGDLNDSGFVSLKDAILALQIAIGLTPTSINLDADVDSDKQISIIDGVFVLQQLADDSAQSLHAGSGTVAGKVLAVDGSGLGNVTLSINDLQTTTDVDGSYTLDNVPISNRHIVDFEKQGYVSTRKIGRVASNQVSTVDAVLAEVGIIQVIDATVGGTITTRGASVTIPANALADSQGNPFAGNATFHVTYFDITDDYHYQALPGELLVVRQNDPTTPFLSKGFINVEIYDGENKLQIADGKTAILSLPIAPSLQARAPDTVPIAWFNIGSGQWLEEGQATRIDNSYQGEVSHFSDEVIYEFVKDATNKTVVAIDRFLKCLDRKRDNLEPHYRNCLVGDEGEEVDRPGSEWLLRAIEHETILKEDVDISFVGGTVHSVEGFDDELDWDLAFMYIQVESGGEIIASTVPDVATRYFLLEVPPNQFITIYFSIGCEEKLVNNVIEYSYCEQAIVDTTTPSLGEYLNLDKIFTENVSEPPGEIVKCDEGITKIITQVDQEGDKVSSEDRETPCSDD